MKVERPVEKVAGRVKRAFTHLGIQKIEGLDNKAAILLK